MLTRRHLGLACICVMAAVELVVTLSATWVFVGSYGRVISANASAVTPGGLPTTALVLGALVSDGQPGDYVRGRLDTALDLYRRGVVTRIINSGNGSSDAGDEPAVMRGYLESHGVPTSSIVDDGGGVDTQTSCTRARNLFGLRAALIVTQDFHAGRAVALCRAAGIDAVAVDAQCPCSWWSVVRNHLRELLLAGPRAYWSATVGY